MTEQKKVTFYYKRLLNRGDHLGRFDYNVICYLYTIVLTKVTRNKDIYIFISK